MEAEVLPGDPHPLEVLGSGEHPLDQLAVLGLDPGPLGEALASFGNAVGELIAHGLQLAEVEHARCRGHGSDPVGNLGVAEGIAEEVRQLRLELGDLPPQLQPRPALVYADAQAVESLLSQ